MADLSTIKAPTYSPNDPSPQPSLDGKLPLIKSSGGNQYFEQSSSADTSGMGGGKAPAGMEYGPTGQLQPISTPPPPLTPISNPVVAPTSTSGAPTPTLPTPTAPGALQSFFGSSTAQVQNAQTQADAQLKQRQDANQAQLDAVTKQQNDLKVLQDAGMAGDLADVQKATEAKQAALDLEKTQYQQNYDLKQGWLMQMQDLVTKGNQMIEQTKGLPIASNILTAKVQQTVSDIAAQVGSIQTLMSAADGQISVAKTQLTTTVDTVSSILKDQTDYYTALQDFYSKQQSSNDAKITTLTKDQKEYLDTKLKQSQDQLAQVQKNAQALATAMENPDTALAYNQAGVTVNDTPEQINQKLATYAYSKELSTQSKDMADKGYSAVIPGQTAPAGSNVISMTDTKGVTHQYYSKAAGLENALKQSEINKNIGTGGAGGMVPVSGNNGTSVNVPLSVAPYYNTSNSGIGYMDASSIQGTATEKAQAIKDAQLAGIKVITNKNTAADLTNITDANAKLDTIGSIMAGIGQPNALSRSLYGIGFTKFAELTQSNPQQAAAGALQAVGLDILKAMSGVQGFRGNSTVVQQINEHMPTIYDTVDTANQKIDYIRQLISDREDGILGKPKGPDLSTFTNGGTGNTNNGSTSNGVDLTKFMQ